MFPFETGLRLSLSLGLRPNARAAGEELAAEAKLLAMELKEACGEEFVPDHELAATLEALAGPQPLDALEKLSSYLRKEGFIPEGMKGMELLQKCKICTAYALEKLDFAGHLLSFLRPEGQVYEEHWTSLTSVLPQGGMKQLIRTLHAVIEIGERFPVWHQKRERGLKALTDAVNLKVKPLGRRKSHQSR